jgi:iron-sulfur cluster assembly accessory protein
MLTVTERAAKKVLALAERDGKPPVLRVGVKGGGCAGYSYFMDLDTAAREGDAVLEVAGLTVRCDAKSLTFLGGTTLDYETNLMNAGFRFNNPSVKRTCGCGESFSV